MQLYPILIVAVVLAADDGLRLVESDLGLQPATITAMTWAPVALGLVILWRATARYVRLIDERRGTDAIAAAETWMRWWRPVLLALHVVNVLVLGALGAMREMIGNGVFIDEALVVLPPLVGVIASWWIHWPVEQRLQRALTIRRLDEGRPTYPETSRLGYVLMQVRVQLLLLLAPAMAILVLSEVFADLAGAVAPAGDDELVAKVATVAGGLGVFVAMPLVADWLLGLRPLPPGELREDLLAVCKRHKVSVWQLHVWPTHGTIINAAVMGLLPPFRVVIMTDAILDSLDRRELLAVMAHEIGHVRRHHMPWLIVALLAVLGAATFVTQLPFFVAGDLIGRLHPDAAAATDAVLQIGAIALALPAFGWMSRRFERQADSFAVEHMSGGAEVTDDAVESMCGALTRISDLDFIDPQRPSWRHGSIEWRRSYLRSLQGATVGRLPIDRTMRWIRWCALGLLVATIAAQFGLDYLARA